MLLDLFCAIKFDVLTLLYHSSRKQVRPENLSGYFIKFNPKVKSQLKIDGSLNSKIPQSG